jgi:8-oxo-dGTP pyrophosphatase MutT (NUDIX family)
MNDIFIHMQTNDIPYFEDEDSKLRPDLPISERETVGVILWNPEKNEVLCLDWPKFDWKTFIIGGVEDGEETKEAAKREIEEETGYADIEFVADLGKLRSAYFATHKNENRIANTTGLLFKLKSTVQQAIDISDLPHVFKWIPKNEVAEYINLSSQKYLWQKASDLV